MNDLFVFVHLYDLAEKIETGGGNRMSGRNCYTREELFQLVRELERLFNLVRILDPASEEQLVPKVDGSLEREPWEELYILMDTPDKLINMVSVFSSVEKPPLKFDSCSRLFCFPYSTPIMKMVRFAIASRCARMLLKYSCNSSKVKPSVFQRV